MDMRLLFILPIIAFQCLLAAEPVKDFLKIFPKEDASIVEWFFRKILPSDAGYVLYGDKPICFEEIRNDPINLLSGEWVSAENRFLQILKGWKLTSNNHRYVFLFCSYFGRTNLIIINRESFSKTVNKDITLFRYILGRPTLTAEGLLEDLVKNEDHFWDVIKDDVALTGILFGYGTNNAVAQPPYECLHTDPIEDQFPYLTTQEEIIPACEQKRASDSRILSTDIKPHESYPIPYFACYPNSEETITLLSTYEKNREAIMAAAHQDNFLESLLQRIFTTTSNTLQLPSVPASRSSFDPTDKQGSMRKLAEIVYNETKIKGLNQEYLVQMFLNGMDDSKKGVKSNSIALSVLCEIGLLEHNLFEVRNLEKSDAILNKVTKNKSWVPLIANNILYKVLKVGRGPPASTKMEDITFHYSFRSTNRQKHLQAGTISHGKLDNLIPGIARSLIGMKKGEERKVIIHPRYAYGDSYPFPNEAMIANIHLVDFKEGEREAPICPEQSLNSHVHRITEGGAMLGSLVVSLPKEHCQKELDPLERIREKPQGSSKEILALYEKSKGEYFYLSGHHFYESLKKQGIPIQCNEFKESINACQKGSQFENAEQRMAFFTDFERSVFYSKHR